MILLLVFFLHFFFDILFVYFYVKIGILDIFVFVLFLCALILKCAISSNSLYYTFVYLPKNGKARMSMNFFPFLSKTQK